jgi:predicted HTH domain antitoxin
MTLTLPDDPALGQVTGEDLRLGLACGLYASGQVSRNVGARIASLDRMEFDEALFQRNIASYTPDMLAEDLHQGRLRFNIPLGMGDREESGQSRTPKRSIPSPWFPIRAEHPPVNPAPPPLKSCPIHKNPEIFLALWHQSAIIVFMKLRISIIALGASLLLNTGCSTVKTAYNGNEGSRFTNPAKLTAMQNPNALPPVAEAPVMQDTHAANPGGTGSGMMTGMSQPDSWGGALSTR